MRGGERKARVQEIIGCWVPPSSDPLPSLPLLPPSPPPPPPQFDSVKFEELSDKDGKVTKEKLVALDAEREKLSHQDVQEMFKR